VSTCSWTTARGTSGDTSSSVARPDRHRPTAAHGVSVNSVQPGLHATVRLNALHGGDPGGAADGIPAGSVGDPDDFGAVVAFLCSEHARYIVGTAVPIEGGMYRGLQ
jgi:3-oxoacyl-[acyl-carrier protein] reductase